MDAPLPEDAPVIFGAVTVQVNVEPATVLLRLMAVVSFEQMLGLRELTDSVGIGPTLTTLVLVVGVHPAAVPVMV